MYFLCLLSWSYYFILYFLIWFITLSYFYIFLLQYFIYFFREGKGGRKRERNINVWLLLSRPLLGTWPVTQACALTGNRTSDPLICRLALNPLSHTSQGIFLYVKLTMHSWNKSHLVMVYNFSLCVARFGLLIACWTFLHFCHFLVMHFFGFDICINIHIEWVGKFFFIFCFFKVYEELVLINLNVW